MVSDEMMVHMLKDQHETLVQVIRDQTAAQNRTTDALHNIDMDLRSIVERYGSFSTLLMMLLTISLLQVGALVSIAILV